MLAVKPEALSVTKVWSDVLVELLKWFANNGKPYSTCSFCNPHPDRMGETQSVAKPVHHAGPTGPPSSAYRVTGDRIEHPVVEV